MIIQWYISLKIYGIPIIYFVSFHESWIDFKRSWAIWATPCWTTWNQLKWRQQDDPVKDQRLQKLQDMRRWVPLESAVSLRFFGSWNMKLRVMENGVMYGNDVFMMYLLKDMGHQVPTLRKFVAIVGWCGNQVDMIASFQLHKDSKFLEVAQLWDRINYLEKRCRNSHPPAQPISNAGIAMKVTSLWFSLWIIVSCPAAELFKRSWMRGLSSIKHQQVQQTGTSTLERAAQQQKIEDLDIPSYFLRTQLASWWIPAGNLWQDSRKPSKTLETIETRVRILGSTQYLCLERKRDRIWHPKDCSNTSRSCSSWTGYGPLNLEAAENGAEGLYEGTKDGEAYSGKQLVIRVLCLLNHNNIRQHHDARCILPTLFKKHCHTVIYKNNSTSSQWTDCLRSEFQMLSSLPFTSIVSADSARLGSRHQEKRLGSHGSGRCLSSRLVGSLKNYTEAGQSENVLDVWSGRWLVLWQGGCTYHRQGGFWHRLFQHTALATADTGVERNL